MARSLTSLELRSRIDSSGQLSLSLVRTDVPAPADDEVTIRVDAAPINPSDLNLLLGPIDLSTLRQVVGPKGAMTTAMTPANRLAGVAAKFERDLPVGNEGAGLVVQAGRTGGAWLGKTVAFKAAGAFAQYKTIKLKDCLILPDGVTAVQGAACMVNPPTAMAMLHTLRSQGHAALVHTAAASSLGQILVKLCLEEHIPLVNIVRSPAQAEILRGIGAEYVCDSGAESFSDDLDRAVGSTRATLAFDAIGGGTMAHHILKAMEISGRRDDPTARYGSSRHKQIYIYGGLDSGPTVLERGYGMAWSVGGWLMSSALATMDDQQRASVATRILAGATSTFASDFVAEVSLETAIEPDTIRRYAPPRTGEKYLLRPHGV